MPDAPPAPVTETAPAQVTTTYVPGGTVPPVGGKPSGTDPAGDSWETSTAAGGREQVLADLARERREAKAAKAELEQLRAEKAKRDQAEMTELEKAQQAAADATARAEKAERAALIRQVAHEKGLPAALAGRLQGKTQADLEADADELLKLMPAGATAPPAGPSGPRPDPSQGASQTPPVRGADLGLAEAKRRFPKHFETKQ